MAQQSNVYGTSSIDAELLGKRIKRIRQAQRLTQQALGKALGISQALVGYYEGGSDGSPSTYCLPSAEWGMSQWTGW